MINFTNILHKNDPIRYQMDVLSDGDISGKCKYDIVTNVIVEYNYEI